MPKIKYFFILLIFTSCLSKKNVSFKNIENISYKTENNSPVLNFDLIVHNPNNWGLRISEINTKVSVEDRSIGITNLPSTIKIARKSDVSIPMQLQLSMADLLTFLPQGLSFFSGEKTKVHTSVDGEITLKKFLFRKRFAVNLKQEVELK
ncbi:MAG: LEA type 2 family protein [Bacteroidia bacterium]|nr:LEA type 2 family protein [Bacteroidia bacterium]